MTALTTAKTPFRRTFSSLGALAFLTLTAAAGSAQASLTLSPQSLVVTPIPPIVLVDPNDVVSSSTIAAPNCSTNPPGKYTCLSNVWQKYCASYWNANDPTNPNNCAAQNQANLTSLGSTLDTQQAQGTVAGGKVFDKAINDFTPTWPTQNATLLVTGKPEDTVNSWAAHESKAKLDAAAAYISDPKTYVRYFPVGNGVAMDHCDKYVYRSFWDIERWIDATNACKNDARCIAQVSMYGMTATGPAYSPGIARKPLMDSDGMAITDRVNARPGKLGLKVTEIDPFTGDYALYGMMPKNNYYLAEQLLSPVLIAGFAASGQDAKVQALANEVHRGATLYDLSAPASTGPTGYQGKTYTDPKGQVHEAFYDEWDFHNVMEQRTRQVTDGEAREYRRRNDALVASWNRLADELKCVTLGSILQVNNGCGPNVPNALGKVNPGDIQEWDGDPLAARLIISQVDPAAWMMPPSVNGMVGYGSALQVSNVTMNQIMAGGVTMGLQALGDTQHLPGLVQPTQLQTYSHTVQTGSTSGTSSGTTLNTNALVLNCALLGTCPPDDTGDAPFFDTHNGDSPLNLKGFIDQLWTSNPPRIDTSVDYPHLNCNIRISRTGGGLVTDALKTNMYWVDVCNFTNLLLEEWGRKLDGKGSCLDPKSTACDWMPQDLVDRLQNKNVDIAAAAKEQTYAYCKRFTYGDQLTTGGQPISAYNRSYLSTMDSVLQQRYNALGQLMKNIPIKATDDFGILKSDKQHIGDDQFGGGYGYDLGWHLKVMQRDANQQICRLGGNAEAQFEAHATLFSDEFSILDAKGTVSANDNDDLKAWVDSKLYVVGYQVFDTNGHYNLTGSPYTKNWGDGDKIQVIEVPFQVAWVTITVSAGIEYDYGVNVVLNAGTVTSKSCVPSNPVLSATATFTPYADLGGWVDADASLLGGLVGVGVEIQLTLVGLQLPLSARLAVEPKNINNVPYLGITFNAGLNLILTTLKGELDFYLKAFWVKVFSMKVFGWDGFSHTFPVFRTPEVNIPLVQLGGGTIQPTSDSDARTSEL